MWARLGLPILLLLAATPAFAATMTWIYTGIVRELVDGTGTIPFPSSLTSLGVQPGTAVTGFVLLDDSLPDTLPADPDTGAYADSVLDGGLVAGALSVDYTAPGQLTAALNRVGNTSLYRISTALNGVTYTPAISSFRLVGIDLVDTGQDVITTEAFPSAPPDLADLDAFAAGVFPNLVTSILIGTDDGIIVAEITSLSLPEPATSWLFGVGLAVAVRASVRRRA